MAQFTGKANVGQPPSGEIKVYLDAAFTKPIESVSEIDFGDFPYKNITEGQQILATKSIHLWARNESTVSARMITSCSNPRVVVSMPGYARTFLQGEVYDWECQAALKGPMTGGALYVQFTVSIATEYIEPI